MSFICSSNNNVSRIQLILEKIRAALGTKLLSAVVKTENGTVQSMDFHTFPSAKTFGVCTSSIVDTPNDRSN